jgi:tRNA pseudouridine38-40 synthase
MRRYVACVEYDGAGFAGWQIQPGQRTIEGELARALSCVAAHPVDIVCAGRTDAGVHATGQIVHFDSGARRSLRGWAMGASTELPADVAVCWVRPVPEHFHARYSALSRTYRYLICCRAARPALARHRAAWLHVPLDLPAMRAAAAHLVGEHDFSAFRAANCQSRSAVRHLHRLDVTRLPAAAAAPGQGDWIEVTATANAFLHHMVRNLVGLLLAVGRGQRPPPAAAELLAARDRRLAPPTAPAEGLYLASVQYPAAFGLPLAAEASAMIPASKS